MCIIQYFIKLRIIHYKINVNFLSLRKLVLLNRDIDLFKKTFKLLVFMNIYLFSSCISISII